MMSSTPSGGLVVTLRRAKSDQESRSQRIGIPYGSSEKACPVRLLQAWLETARIVVGPLFRSLDKFRRVQPRRLSDKAVARIVKRRAKADMNAAASTVIGAGFRDPLVPTR